MFCSKQKHQEHREKQEMRRHPGRRVYVRLKASQPSSLAGFLYSSDSATHSGVSSAWVDFHLGFLSSWEAKIDFETAAGLWELKGKQAERQTLLSRDDITTKAIKNWSIKCSVEKRSITSGWWQVLMIEKSGRSLLQGAQSSEGRNRNIFN